MSRSKGDGPDAAQEPIRVKTREEFDAAVAELQRPDVPIEAPSLDALAAWDLDLEDGGAAMEGER